VAISPPATREAVVAHLTPLLVDVSRLEPCRLAQLIAGFVREPASSATT
jgi:hypothetical protein